VSTLGFLPEFKWPENETDFSALLSRDISKSYSFFCGPGSSGGTATGYGLDDPGSKPGGGEIFCASPDRPWDPPSLLYSGYRVFPEGKERPGRDAEPSSPSSAEVMKV
jgi:hypothetical protein